MLSRGEIVEILRTGIEFKVINILRAISQRGSNFTDSFSTAEFYERNYALRVNYSNKDFRVLVIAINLKAQCYEVN